ncbi:hypothetical protein [Streptomyces sp. NPDC048603]|uniref:hypothetical protein n=1 Tax=Streptomyces sp. NPDC048603 TaxID=3365577 RepID=UPI003718810B
MAEHFVTLPCEPCERCVFHAWQRVEGGRLRWYSDWTCDNCDFAGPSIGCVRDGGWGPAAYEVRERIVEQEGTVRVRIGGPDGVPLKAAREILGLTIAELNRLRVHGYDATPVEAALLESRRTAGT